VCANVADEDLKRHLRNARPYIGIIYEDFKRHLRNARPYVAIIYEDFKGELCNAICGHARLMKSPSRRPQPH